VKWNSLSVIIGPKLLEIVLAHHLLWAVFLACQNYVRISECF